MKPHHSLTILQNLQECPLVTQGPTMTQQPFVLPPVKTLEDPKLRYYIHYQRKFMI